jgi:outer membrane protein TolC
VFRGGAATLALALLSACAHYQEKPLSEESLAASDRALPSDQLTQAAASPKHPALPPVTMPADGSLSPESAAIVAVLQSPALRAVRDRRGVAQAQVLQAGILPNPQLAASVDFPAFGSTQGTVPGYSVGGTWDITALITRSAGRSAAEHEAAAVDLEIAWQEWQAAMGAKLHATRVLALSAQRDELQRQVTEAEGIAQRAEEDARAGLVTTVDRDAGAALLQKRRSALLAGEATLRSEMMQLREAVGVPSDVAFVVVPDSGAGELPVPVSADVASVIDESRLDLAALRAGYAAQEEKLRGAVLSQFPRIGLGLTAARDTTNVGTIGLGITLDLPIFDRAQGKIAIETATRQQLFDEFAARRFEAQSDAARAITEFGALKDQIQEAEASVDRLTRLVETLESARREGYADIIQLNQVRSDLADARLEVLKLRQQQDEQRIGVEVATGRWLGRRPVEDGS